MSSSALNKAVERAIRKSTGATKILDCDSLQPVWGGNGEVLRVELAGAPADSVIVKRITVPSGTKRNKKNKDASLARTLASYDNELAFYQDYSKQLLASRVRVPHFYSGQRLEDGWVFVLEDLLSEGFACARKEYSTTDIEAGLKWLSEFHAAFLGNSGTRLWKAGSYWNLANREAERAQMTNSRLKGSAVALDAAINQGKFKTLIHGDAKTDNFCFPVSGSGAVAGLDFQYVGLGCGMKDVMCLLDSCLDPYEVELESPRHLDFYFQELSKVLQEREPAIDVAAVEKEWRQLYPVAWADYYRFLDGWAPGKYPPEGHTEEMLKQALAYLTGR